jgi:hypothetical protein
MGKSLCDLTVGKNFLRQNTKTTLHKRINQTLLKFDFKSNFLIFKTHIKTMKRPTNIGRKILAKHICDNGLLTRVYFSNLSKLKTSN